MTGKLALPPHHGLIFLILGRSLHRPPADMLTNARTETLLYLRSAATTMSLFSDAASNGDQRITVAPYPSRGRPAAHEELSPVASLRRK
jgi:hypothetical protein